MQKMLAAATTAVCLLGVAACGNSSPASSGTTGSKTGGTLTLAPILPPLPWDLKQGGSGNQLQYYQPVYDTLLRIDGTGKPTPNVVDKWEYNADRTELTLHLRPDAGTFTDGTPVDATAVKANLDNTESGAAEAAFGLKLIKSTEVVDPTTVKLTLLAPSPNLLQDLGSVSGMLASPKAISAGSLAQEPVGSGPYTLDKGKTTTGSVYTYVRNAKYWNAKAFPFDSVVMKPLTDPTAVLNALRSGQIDAALLSTPKNVAPAEGAGLKVVRYEPGTSEGVYIFDRGGKIVPALGNVKVRQAINMVYDRPAIVKTVNLGLGTPSTQVFLKAQPAYDPALDSRYPYDVAGAKQLMAEAGYPNGFDVTVPDLAAVFPQQQTVFVKGLQDLGIRVNLDKISVTEAIPSLLGGKYPLSYFPLGGGTESWSVVAYELLAQSPWNPMHYSDPQADALIAQAQNASGAEADAAYKKLNAYTVEQAWNAPWDQSQGAYATNKKIKIDPFAYNAVPDLYFFKPAS
jgi:peptide/nickel transport system substrate-binding protein